MKNALVIDGFNQKVTGERNDWDFAGVLSSAGFGVTAREECVWNWDSNVVRHSDLATFWNVIPFYSWGYDSLVELGLANMSCNLAIGVLPVQDPCGLCDDITLPNSVKKAVVFQATPSREPNDSPSYCGCFPVSKPLSTSNWVGFVDMDDPTIDPMVKSQFWANVVNVLAQDDPQKARLNININCLAANEGAVENHQTLENDPRVLSLAERIALEFA